MKLNFHHENLYENLDVVRAQTCASNFNSIMKTQVCPMPKLPHRQHENLVPKLPYQQHENLDVFQTQTSS
jgi:hypothetical protein